ncbi:hypothetical protein PR048_024644 [Dryococelus australis]|uniref:Uncharacterized protein n=1 Tax=Dryococelus australis TaxID=614101 RepID=A0ABQ9GP80_9NEOP|nr:hypothetical protein PR048_024644 [Dryococelus australis]
MQGWHPRRLIELWNKFAVEKTTENDSPEMFGGHQLFIILELGNAGLDLEAYMFLSAHQTLSVSQKVTCGLEVTEVELEFEHRNLHLGNVLV